MGKIKLHQLKDIKQCNYKGYLSQLNFKTLNNKSSMIREIYKTILRDYDFVKLSQEELKSILTETLEEKFFLTDQEKEVELKIILNHLLRYIKYEKEKNRKIIHKNIRGTINAGDNDIEVKADIVFENEDSIEIVKYKVGATTLSYKARTDKNLPKNDIELFLLKKLGEKLYSSYGKPVISSFYHMKGKKEDKEIYEQFLEDKSKLIVRVKHLQSFICNDKKEQKIIDKQIKEIKDVLNFNNTIGNNIITYDYSDEYLMDEVATLSETKLNANSEKCKSADCEFCNYTTLCNFNKEEGDNSLIEIAEQIKSDKDVILTESQKQVVGIEKGNYRINACCGSGKSTTMVMRTIELFKKGYLPKDILMITFTNKGAQELKDKIRYWSNYYGLNNINVDYLNIYTFNSFCGRIVSSEWEKLGFEKKPSLASTIDINDIIKELLKEYKDVDWLNYKNPLMNFPNAKGAFKQLVGYFDMIKSFDYDEKSLLEEILIKEKDFKTIKDYISKSKVIFEMYNSFNDKLKGKNLFQYQDQILYANELFENYPESINKYGFSHVIVDEYQDTDLSQVKLLHLLEKYSCFKSLMVVGDNSQAIYSFRNTTPKNIIDFDKEFEDVKDISLLDNFRSTSQICFVANELDKLNIQRIDKEIISKKKDGCIPKLIQYESLEEENKDIVDTIKQYIESGIPRNEICYIARTKKELLELQSLLNKEDIPNIIEASELYIDNSYVQCISNLANFFKNADHDYYLMEYMSFIFEGFELMNAETIRCSINEFKQEIIEDFEKLEDEESRLKYFFSLINPLTEDNDIGKSFTEILEEKNFHTSYELFDYLHKMLLYKDNTSIVKDDKKYDAIVLTTAHSSKGKEWDVVINSINKYKYSEIKEDLDIFEEERRLLFVSITRAKTYLYITYNTNEDKARNKGKYCGFADEIQGVERLQLNTNN